MLRAVLAGLLSGWVVVGVSLSAVPACDRSSDGPVAAVGTAAGKVVEVTGTARATRAGQPRVLAKGAEVYADDIVETAADGTIEIELFHNTARWSLQHAKRVRVDQSLAWGLTKQQATAAAEHNTAAAGRNAERSAADTGATTGTEGEAEGGAETDEKQADTPRPVVAAQPPAMPPPAPLVGSQDDGRRRASRAESMRSDKKKDEPPPPPKLERSTGAGRGGAATGGVPGGASAKGGAPGGGAAQSSVRADGDLAPPPPPPSSSSSSRPAEPERRVDEKAIRAPMRDTDGAQVRALLEKQRAALAKCVDPGAPHLTIVVRLAKGTPTFELTGTGNRSDKVRSCIAGVIKKIAFPAIDAQGSIELLK